MSPKKRIRTCVLYVRISLSSEESVSIERQIEAGTAYAAARGWTVLDVFRDEGVSATHNKPEVRKGWKDLLASTQPYDAVIVWKVDRLARRVIDFLNANEAVKARGAGIVAVEDPIDMTTAQGEAFAIMLAVFGQLEAAAISARVTAARSYLLRNSRHAGGRVAYGWRSVPNPTGPGYIVVQDEGVIDYVREMVRRTMAGLSIYSTQQWLEEVKAPTPTMILERRKAEAEGTEPPADPEHVFWGYNTVNKIVRHPMLAGMIPHNPGTRGKERGDGIVRDDDGLPVVDESLAIMTVGEWRAMQAKLAEPIRTVRQPHAMRKKRPDNGLVHSSALSGLVWCGDLRDHAEPVRMRRGSTGNSATKLRPSYYCPECHQSLTNGEDLIVRQFLAERGHLYNLRMMEEVIEGGSVQLAEATIRLAELGKEAVTATGERRRAIQDEMARLWEIQDEAAALPGTVRLVPVGGEDRTFAEDWAAATTDEERRDIIGQALDRVIVRRGKTGGRSDANKLARMEFAWRDAGDVWPTDEAVASAAASDEEFLRRHA